MDLLIKGDGATHPDAGTPLAELDRFSRADFRQQGADAIWVFLKRAQGRDPCVLTKFKSRGFEYFYSTAGLLLRELQLKRPDFQWMFDDLCVRCNREFETHGRPAFHG